MAHPQSQGRDRAIERCADGTVKQRNLLTGTEVWTVPGRGQRPLAAPHPLPHPLDPATVASTCPFCPDRYFDTPPEKSRLVRRSDGAWEELRGLSADQLHETVAEFRRIPNLFEIVSYNYWHLNHGHVPSEHEHRRMAEYLARPSGYDHVMRVVRARLRAGGVAASDLDTWSDSRLLQQANGFFSGGHDVIVARRHFVDGATLDTQLASSGTMTPEEHYHYIDFTARTMADLYRLDPAVRYVAAFQNWLRPAGSSLDHLHKQVVAIDERSVQTESELEHLRRHPGIYDEILGIEATRHLLVAQNPYAVAMAGFGHRYPTVAVWPLGDPVNPWDATPEQVRGVSDVLHAVHAATGPSVPCNEEWYHRPPSVDLPMRWRILVKWRISTLAGFEGGTRIYLNTLDPWQIRDRTVERLQELRARGTIAPMQIGDECHVTPDLLRGSVDAGAAPSARA